MVNQERTRVAQVLMSTLMNSRDLRNTVVAVVGSPEDQHLIPVGLHEPMEYVFGLISDRSEPSIIATLENGTLQLIAIRHGSTAANGHDPVLVNGETTIATVLAYLRQAGGTVHCEPTTHTEVELLAAAG